MTIYFPSSHIIKHVLAGDNDAIASQFRNRNYDEISFAHKALCGESALKVVKALKTLQVPKINFNANQLNSPHLGDIIKYIGDLDTVSLELAKNDLGPKGAEAICSQIGKTKLKTLNVAHNYLGPTGAAMIYQICHARNIKVCLQHNYNWEYQAS